MTKSPDGGVAHEDQVYYRPGRLRTYDLLILRLSNSLLWRCPTSLQLQHYDRNISAKHLDIGPGSGYYLDHCTFPETPSISLLDLNPSPLEFVSRRISRYAPRKIVADICKPGLEIGQEFTSVALNYVMHCLPDQDGDREATFANIRNTLVPGGLFFGSTVMGKGVHHTPFSRRVNEKYNQIGAFHNRNDSPERLERLLSAQFEKCEIRLHGAVALFSATAA
ncbi:methyltransferase [Amycolatopsis sp. NPDC059657]|uniref:methyltransferase n=1 Tax=Amycolatopsis sp. NPDC059657 TaxID=3346899 RepID=UPI00366E362F